MKQSPTLWTEYVGWWCENCRTPWPYEPRSGKCKDCDVPLRKAKVRVDLDVQ